MHRYILGIIIALLCLSGTAAGQQVDTVGPTFIAGGSELVIRGSDLGTRRPRVRLESLGDENARRPKVKITSFSSTEIRLTLRRGKPGFYDVVVKLRGTPSGKVRLTAGTVAVASPVLDESSSSEQAPLQATIGEAVTLTGGNFGTTAGKVWVGGRQARVLSWTDTAVTYRVPRSIPIGLHTVRLRTKTGSVFARGISFVPEDRVLPVRYSPQQTQVWCWAACDEMLFDYHGFNYVQCEIVSYFCGANACVVPGACLFTAPSVPAIQQSLAVGGLRSKRSGGPLSFEELGKEISAKGRPVIAAYLGSFSGHVVVIYGWHRDGTVDIHDPFYGTYNRVRYGDAFSYLGGGGPLRWVDTIYGVRR